MSNEILVGIIVSVAAGVILLVIEYRTRWFARRGEKKERPTSSPPAPDNKQEIRPLEEAAEDQSKDKDKEFPPILTESQEKKLLKVSSASKMEAILLHVLEGHENWVWGLAFSPNGELLATGSTDHTVRLWNIQEGHQVREFEAREDRYDQDAGTFCIAYSLTGRMLASGHGNGKVHLWNPQSGRHIESLEGMKADYERHIVTIGFRPDGRSLAIGNSRNKAEIWDVESYQKQMEYSWHVMAFSSDMSLAAVKSADKTIKLHRFANPDQSKQFVTGPAEAIVCGDISPDNALLAAGTEDFSVYLWNIRGTKNSKWMQSHDKKVNVLTFSPDGRTLASGSEDHTVRLWDVTTAREKQRLEASADIRSLAYSPDGRLLAVGTGGFHEHRGKVMLWRI